MRLLHYNFSASAVNISPLGNLLRITVFHYREFLSQVKLSQVAFNAM